MYNTDTILADFFSKKYVTLRRSISSDFDMELELLDKSVKGIYFDDGHPLVKQSIMDSFKDFDPNITTFAVTTYEFGQIVDDGGQLYESLIASNTDPTSTTSSWRATDQLSLFHRSIIKRSVDKLLSDVINTDPFIDDVVFQRYSPTDRFKVDNLDKRVGFMFIPKDMRNAKFTFNRIGSQFDGAETFDLELHKGDTLINTFSVTAGEEFAWDDAITFDLDDDTYFLSYDQTGFTQQAINAYGWESLSFTDTFCNDYLNIQPFIADLSKPLTQIAEGEFRYGINYGLALDFTVSQDLTNWMVRNLPTFSKAIQIQYAYDLLEEIVYNPANRSNGTQRNSQNTRIAEVEITNLNDNTIARSLMLEKKKLKRTIEQISVNDKSFQKKEGCIFEQDYS